MELREIGVMQARMSPAGALPGIPHESLVVVDNQEHLSDCELPIYASGIPAESLRNWVRQEQQLRSNDVSVEAIKAAAAAPGWQKSQLPGGGLQDGPDIAPSATAPSLDRLADAGACPVCGHATCTFSESRQWVCDACAHAW